MERLELWPVGETVCREGVDLLAGTFYSPPAMPSTAPTVLVFDSGLGGLTVYREVRKALPGVRLRYAADDAGFPYGRLTEDALVERVVAVMRRLVERERPDLVVIACNTASTLVLPALRAAFHLPFVGTVPAIKPAAALSKTGRVAVLATPGTVKRDYTRALIDRYAKDVAVELVGAVNLAALAEAALKGEMVSDEAIAAEIAPCFVEADGRRTDVVVLACTHYPLLIERFRRLAPWPVEWLDPAPAIARRAAVLLGPSDAVSTDEPAAIFTGAAPGAALLRALAAEGLGAVEAEPLPLARQ